MEYTQEELTQLHEVLYDILEEIVRVCDVCGIPYFIQGELPSVPSSNKISSLGMTISTQA